MKYLHSSTCPVLHMINKQTRYSVYCLRSINSLIRVDGMVIHNQKKGNCSEIIEKTLCSALNSYIYPNRRGRCKI
jgi:hypothetical protein